MRTKKKSFFFCALVENSAQGSLQSGTQASSSHSPCRSCRAREAPRLQRWLRTSETDIEEHFSVRARDGARRNILRMSSVLRRLQLSKQRCGNIVVGLSNLRRPTMVLNPSRAIRAVRRSWGWRSRISVAASCTGDAFQCCDPRGAHRAGLNTS